MRTIIDLATLSWSIRGYRPHSWRMPDSLGWNPWQIPEAGPFPARFPGSVQQALRDAGQLPDWNEGDNWRACAWVETLDWAWTATLSLPELAAAETGVAELCFEGLDHAGEVFLDGRALDSFDSAFLPWRFSLPLAEASGDRTLAMVFTGAPRWLGQTGFTSRMTEGKPRFYYGWDWVPRLVQTGVWDAARVEIVNGPVLGPWTVKTDFEPFSGSGKLAITLDGSAGVVQDTGDIKCRGLRLRVSLRQEPEGPVITTTECGSLEAPLDSQPLAQVELRATGSGQSIVLGPLKVKPWQARRAGEGLPVSGGVVAAVGTAGTGGTAVYRVRLELLDADDQVIDRGEKIIGFRSLNWKQCQGAPAGADPWILEVNGNALLLAGVNWTPVRPFFADTSAEEEERLLRLYAALGFNLIRVWGGAVLERDRFYEICDRLGLLVWQELPLSSSGLDNWPPEDPDFIQRFADIAGDWARRRSHHPSLLLWCGGNELQGNMSGEKTGLGLPVGPDHPALAAAGAVLAGVDPERRFLATSSSGPRFMAMEEDFGKGLHWDVHGPWTPQVDGKTLAAAPSNHVEKLWQRYWTGDDALFRSELGCPGAASLEVQYRWSGGLQSLPVDSSNPYWRRSAWWIEDRGFRADHGRQPESLEEYVAWSRERQARCLVVAVRSVLERFPCCGGFILWMGHDCFPCPSNTSIIDFDGKPKPAAIALAALLHEYLEAGNPAGIQQTGLPGSPSQPGSPG
jgi:beta-mannosidase